MAIRNVFGKNGEAATLEVEMDFETHIATWRVEHRGQTSVGTSHDFSFATTDAIRKIEEYIGPIARITHKTKEQA